MPDAPPRACATTFFFVPIFHSFQEQPARCFCFLIFKVNGNTPDFSLSLSCSLDSCSDSLSLSLFSLSSPSCLSLSHSLQLSLYLPFLFLNPAAIFMCSVSYLFFFVLLNFFIPHDKWFSNEMSNNVDEMQQQKQISYRIHIFLNGCIQAAFFWVLLCFSASLLEPQT